MIALRLDEVAAACGGRLEAGDPGVLASGVVIDSRAVAPGDLFFGLRGESADGGDFAGAALGAGAAAAVVTPRAASSLRAGAPRIVVDDPLRALGALAAGVRRRSGAAVVAVTGSAGKTSTKDILAALLAPVARVVATSGNHNNEIGVPLTVFELEPDTEVLVCELAMRGRGQIAELAAIVKPDVGVITNIAPVHLELVGTIEEVAAAKAEIIAEVGKGALVVPADEVLLEPHLRYHTGRLVTFGAEGADICVAEAQTRGFGTHALIDAFGRRAVFDFNFGGGHYLQDALAAIGAFIALGYNLEEAKSGAAAVEFSALRGRIAHLPDGGLLLNDAYNANPLFDEGRDRPPLPGGRRAAAGGRARRHVRARRRRGRLSSRGRTARRRPGRAGAGRGRPCARLPDDAGRRLVSDGRRVPGGAAGGDRPRQRRARQGLAGAAHRARRRGHPGAARAARLHNRHCVRARPWRDALMFTALAAGITSMVVMLIVGPWFIEWLRRNEFGQTIREEGPEGHKTKEGTPTMGGVLIWLAVLVPFFIFSQLSVASFSVLVIALGCALIGFADDWMKIIKGRSLGLSARYKLLLQLALGLLAGFIALHFAGLTTSVSIPFSHAQWHLGTVGFYVLVFLVIASASNTVNLTDGLDGLAAGSSAIVLLAYAGIAFIIGRHEPDPGILDLSVLSTCIVGACLGFLWFNTFPADVFMGDTGSLGLGGAIAGLAILTRTELLLIVIAGIFVLEGLSVILQVASFKLTKRRIFLMAPLHHHFELLNWSETKVIVRFWIVTAILAGLGFAIYYATF